MKKAKRLKQKVKKQKRIPDVSLTVGEHLEELRRRFVLVIVFFFLTSVLSYFIYPQALYLLTRLYDKPLFYTSPVGGIDLAMKVSTAIGFILTMPLFVFELFAYVRPAVPVSLQRSFVWIVTISTFLLVTGVSFAYFVTLPATLRFMTTFQVENVAYFVSISNYVSFILQYLVAFGVVFQIPLVFIFLNSIFHFSLKQLMRYQTWVIIISFVVAAIVTPTPDPINQAIVALPLIALYEITVVAIYIMNRGRSSR